MRAAILLVAALSLGADAAQGDPVVARAGGVAVHASELERRLSDLAPFQLAELGGDAAAIRRRFLVEVVLPDALLVAGAEAQGLTTRQPTSYLVRRALSNATIRATRAAVPPPAASAVEDLRAYYEANRARWDQPERISVWRILTKTREEAAAVLAEARKDPTPAAWTKLARDKSIDKATYLRGGNLGFLMPDGASNEAGFKVDVAVVQAARDVKDGELVPRVVEEPGAGFAVVWRRGTVAATKRTFEELVPQLRELVYRQKLDEAHTRLLAELKAKNVKQLDVDLVRSIDFTPDRPLKPPPPPSPSR